VRVCAPVAHSGLTFTVELLPAPSASARTWRVYDHRKTLAAAGEAAPGKAGKAIARASSFMRRRKSTASTVSELRCEPPPAVAGDVKVVVHSALGKLCQLWFHTARAFATRAAAADRPVLPAVPPRPVLPCCAAMLRRPCRAASLGGSSRPARRQAFIRDGVLRLGKLELDKACKNKQLPDSFAVELCFEPAAEGEEGERQRAALAELEGRAVGDDESSHETDDEAGWGDDHEIDSDDEDELTRTHSLQPGQTAKDGKIAQDQWM
jgi:hypothetical protein